MDYVLGKGSLRWCSARHHIPYQTILKKAAREDWSQQREQWFAEKRMREQIPQVAAMINPPVPDGHGPPPPLQPLTRDFYLYHHNKYAQNLNSIDEEIAACWKMLRDDRTNKVKISIEERVMIMKAIREYIELQKTILGIPGVKPISREPGNPKPKRGTRSLSVDVIPLTSDERTEQDGARVDSGAHAATDTLVDGESGDAAGGAGPAPH